MPEFALPAFDQWRRRVQMILDKINWPEQERPALLSRPAYNVVRAMFTDALELPSHRDYYREERAALVCADFMVARPDLWAHGTGFLLAMAASEHTITRISGLQIALALYELRNEMNLESNLASSTLSLLTSEIRNIIFDLERFSADGLKDVAAAKNLAENCSHVVRDWLKQGRAGPLTEWLSKTA